MKSNFYLANVLLLSCSTMATLSVAQQKVTKQEKVYHYESDPGDPIHARIYTLDNGLKVYISVNKDAPRVQTCIPVRTGSKNDPSDATGLSHYLEHMLFKGTDKFGTKNFAKEKVELRKIDSLYDVYGKITDAAARKKIYHIIDSISGVASRYSIANEYDKMMANIGAKGTNAYTWVEQTVYVNDIPSNQIHKWLTIEGERFRKPVMRLFHTELEAVYEEKNRTLDNDNDKMWDMMFANLWKKHTYGTQTTIGTIEHLKNPSLKKISAYESTYYVPNNMAICLAGDINPDSTIKWVDQTFGSLPSKPIPTFHPPVEDAIASPIERTVVGPFPETMFIGFRLPGSGTQEADILELMNEILANGKAGLIDLDLVQKQKVLSASADALILKDYSAHLLSADPKQGQKLEELKDLLLAEVGKVKKGDFPDWLLPAIINNLKLKQIKTYETNNGRANAFVNAFIFDESWKNSVGHLERLSKITKQQIVDFANKYYGNNYVVVYKRTGVDSTAQKVEKPEIHPVETNRGDQSEFVKNIINTSVSDIQPKFLDYSKDIQKFTVGKNIPLLYTSNKEDKTFSMYYILDMGSNSDKKLSVAIQYLPYLGTSKYTPEQLQQEFYKLACSFGVLNSNDQVYVYLSGLTENFDKGLALFEHLLSDAKPNPPALTNLVSDIMKKRSDAKLDKNVILQQGLFNYAKYGAKSPFTNILSEKELQSLAPNELVDIVKSLTGFNHRILYYGSMDTNALLASLNKNHKTPATLKSLPKATKFEEIPTPTNQVFAIDYDMAQVEVMMISKSENYYKDLAPSIRLFNAYFGGGMSSIVFQELRESKALAYSVFSTYAEAKKIEDANYIFSYIGSQVDKLPEALDGLLGLLRSMPESEHSFMAAKNAVLENIRTNRITRTGILFNYEAAKKLDLDYDIRKDVYAKVPAMKMADVKRFHSEHVSNKNFVTVVIGNKKLIDEKVLEKYGPVKWLTLENVFGY